MRVLKSWIVALLLSVAGLSVSIDPASAQSANNLTGVWQGVFWGGGQQPTEFQTTLRDEPGPGFVGSIVESNVFGEQVSPFLLSTLTGQTRGDAISFTKTYDGTAGQAHSVTYTGQIVSERHIVGTWSIGGLSGQFEMAR